MGQKVNPHALRIGLIKDWDSEWYEDGSEFCVEDYACEGTFLRSRFKVKDWDSYLEKISIKVQNFVIRRRNDCRKMKKYILLAFGHRIYKRQKVLV